MRREARETKNNAAPEHAMVIINFPPKGKYRQKDATKNTPPKTRPKTKERKKWKAVKKELSRLLEERVNPGHAPRN